MLEKWYLFYRGNHEFMREIESRRTVLLTREVGLTLGKVRSIASGASRPDFAGNIGCFAEGIETLQSELLPERGRAQLDLQSVIVRVTVVGAFLNQRTSRAVDPAY